MKEIPADGTGAKTLLSGLLQPEGLALDAAGNLYIANTSNDEVVVVPPGGGSSRKLGSFSHPSGVALDSSGNVYVSEFVGAKVSKVARTVGPTLSFADTLVGNTSNDSPKTVTVENIGNDTLTGTVGAPSNGSFTVGLGGCGTTLSLVAGTYCTLSYNFMPLAGGALSGMAVLTDNSLNSNAMQSILLGGNGVALGQTITFNALPDRAVGATFILSATASSNLPVRFTSNTTTVCTVSGTTANLLTPGTCTIQADQAGNAMYSPAPSVSQSFNVIGTGFLTGQTLGSLRNNYTGFVGFQFTVGSTPVTVYGVGRIVASGNTQTHTVKLVNANGTDVPGGSASVATTGGTVGQYKFANLANGVTLLANTTYYLVSQETAGGDQWYDYGPVSSTSVASVNAPVYTDSSITMWR